MEWNRFLGKRRRDDIRSFSVDAIEFASELDKSAVSVDKTVLESELDAGYGIFSGGATKLAKLKFLAQRPAGRNAVRWQLSADFAFYDDRELMHDILRQGSHVDILEPEELKIRVKQELQSMLGKL